MEMVAFESQVPSPKSTVRGDFPSGEMVTTPFVIQVQPRSLTIGLVIEEVQIFPFRSVPPFIPPFVSEMVMICGSVEAFAPELMVIVRSA